MIDNRCKHGGGSCIYEGESLESNHKYIKPALHINSCKGAATAGTILLI